MKELKNRNERDRRERLLLTIQRHVYDPDKPPPEDIVELLERFVADYEYCLECYRRCYRAWATAKYGRKGAKHLTAKCKSGPIPKRVPR